MQCVRYSLRHVRAVLCNTVWEWVKFESCGTSCFVPPTLCSNHTSKGSMPYDRHSYVMGPFLTSLSVGATPKEYALTEYGQFLLQCADVPRSHVGLGGICRWKCLGAETCLCVHSRNTSDSFPACFERVHLSCMQLYLFLFYWPTSMYGLGMKCMHLQMCLIEGFSHALLLMAVHISPCFIHVSNCYTYTV